MYPCRRAALLVGCLVAAAAARAQQPAHEMPGMMMDSAPSRAYHLMLQAIPLATRADPSAGGVARAEVNLTQVVLMAHGTWWNQHAEIAGAFDAEGLTMPNGELNTGAYGEGYVDRRHPHTYLHEAVLTARGNAGPVGLSLSGGRGFASFGTDDPMMRPLVKFPINHHLSQILERGILTGAARWGAMMLEVTSFGGDEPTSPSSLPRPRRLGDSWSARATLLPRPGLEAQASYARVASPEDPGGFGLDQRKQNVSARSISAKGGRYMLFEWARTVELDRRARRDVFAYESALAEAAMRVGIAGIALRIEQTDRPEEDRLADPFRTPRPPSDLSINGITRWRVATVQLSAPAVTRAFFSGFPFIEAAHLSAAARDSRSLFSPDRLYGTRSFWMLTAGFRLRVGDAHGRMGRYGVAVSDGPAISAVAGAEEPQVHHH